MAEMAVEEGAVERKGAVEAAMVVACTPAGSLGVPMVAVGHGSENSP